MSTNGLTRNHVLQKKRRKEMKDLLFGKGKVVFISEGKIGSYVINFIYFSLFTKT
jgi:hypothetical protein